MGQRGRRDTARSEPCRPDHHRQRLEYFTPLDEDEVPDGDASNTWWDARARQQIAARIAEDCNVLGGGWSWSQSGRFGANNAGLPRPTTATESRSPASASTGPTRNFPRPSLMGGDDWRVETELCDDGVGVDLEARGLAGSSMPFAAPGGIQQAAGQHRMASTCFFEHHGHVS